MAAEPFLPRPVTLLDGRLVLTFPTLGFLFGVSFRSFAGGGKLFLLLVAGRCEEDARPVENLRKFKILAGVIGAIGVEGGGGTVERSEFPLLLDEIAGSLKLLFGGELALEVEG